MRTQVLLTALIFVFSCSNKKTKDNSVFYSVVGSTGKITQDTTHSLKENQADTADKLLAQTTFTYLKKDHFIKVYSSDNHAPVDGGQLYYTLDSIGIIYSQSTTWPGFGRLKSSNDSINDLITQAFSHIIEKPLLHCYLCTPDYITRQTIIPPVMMDK